MLKHVFQQVGRGVKNTSQFANPCQKLSAPDCVAKMLFSLLSIFKPPEITPARPTVDYQRPMTIK
jgi:hypothetical protein